MEIFLVFLLLWLFGFAPFLSISGLTFFHIRELAFYNFVFFKLAHNGLAMLRAAFYCLIFLFIRYFNWCLMCLITTNCGMKYEPLLCPVLFHFVCISVRRQRHTYWQVLACATWQCVWLLALALFLVCWVFNYCYFFLSQPVEFVNHLINFFVCCVYFTLQLIYLSFVGIEVFFPFILLHKRKFDFLFFEFCYESFEISFLSTWQKATIRLISNHVC